MGLVDSILEPTPEVVETFDIDIRENYVASESPATTNHGGDVLELLCYFAPEAVFNLYRVVVEHGDAKRGNLVQAIYDASEHDVDLLNLSVGLPHLEESNHDCGGNCRVADETRLAVQEGTTVIAAAGNRDKNDPLAVHCPASLEETIGIGGFVSRCRHELIQTVESRQYWVKGDELRGPYCGQRDCGPNDSCSEYRYEHPWRGNVSFHNTAPDALAPVHHLAGGDSEPVLQSGTSFGTPIVSGLLAATISDLAYDPGPAELKRAVRLGATEIDEGGLAKFQGRRTREILESE